MELGLISIGLLWPLLFPLIIVLVVCIRQINQYERGVVFTMGKYSRTWQPGWKILIPVFQRLHKVDIRVKAVDVPDQEAITKDNIPIRINAVIYYRIADAAKAIIAVEDFFNAVSQLAQTTMRNAVGEVKLDELLSQKKEVSERIKLVVDRVSDEWGVDVQSVELKDIVLPENLKRTIAKVAEAEREKQAVIISSEGELAASQNVAKAAEMLASAPGALHLRTLQSINDISSDQSNTTVWMIPVEALRALEGLAKK
ncbi:MAG: SPFH domain-containing protein [Candidatus Peribacteraceae bacterium]|nr:SPFH domain-containing protein [Candidatus Peribacteraceae bacterium]